jgi:hypothetical protein
MTDEPTPHVYGTPAEEKQIPPAAEGLRGEGNSDLADAPPEQTREITAKGRKIKVEETSGIASAESAGKLGKAEQ